MYRLSSKQEIPLSVESRVNFIFLLHSIFQIHHKVNYHLFIYLFLEFLIFPTSSVADIDLLHFGVL